ncbi:MAG: hypothetical protein AAB407_02190 [Patescibacteria group bacterium]
MPLSDEAIKEFQEIYKKEHNKELSWDEASEAAHNLMNYAKLLVDLAEEDYHRQLKLKDNPKGFQLDGVGYTCFICGCGTQAGGNWYDKYGIKCTICQNAINRKEVPPSLAKNKESWYSKYDLESRFNLKASTIRSWIKKGILKARTITRDGESMHVQLFLIRDNRDMLPPKKLTESHMVKEVKDGKEWFHSEPWYRFVDPHEHLKGYRIMDHLRVTKGEEQKEHA